MVTTKLKKISFNAKPFLKKLFIVFLDLASVTLAWFGAYWLRFSFDIPIWFFEQALDLAPLVLGIQAIVLLVFRLDRLIPRFTSLPDLTRILGFSLAGVGLSTLAIFLKLSGFQGFPRSIPALDLMLIVLLVSGWRILPRLIRENRGLRNHGKKTIIIGAGQAGEMLARDMIRHVNSKYRPLAFLDDDPNKKGRLLHGLPVAGTIKDLPELAKRFGVDLVVIAIPSANKKTIGEIVEICDDAGVEYRILPSAADIISGRVTVSDIRRVTIEDLLGRKTVPPRRDLLERCIKNKVVMITGAGGSIGSELCRQVSSLNPKRVILFEHSEYALYKIDSELKQELQNRVEVIPILGSVNNFKRVKTVLSVFNVGTVYHAAAYKHVPLVEYNPIEGIRNNLFGTLNTALAALECGVETFLLISTDKAVRPTNIMGASKRLSEMVLQALSQHQIERNLHPTVFTMVRFGNVLGSSGSVVPLFRKQIEQGGPVTVTHPEITRYFMTIPEAVQLVIQAGSMAKGGEVFVLDMGEPVKIMDLAQKMIKLSGFTIKDANNPTGDIEIVFTGLRSGEKLYEELLISENVSPTKHPMILMAKEIYIEWDKLQRLLKQLDMACNAFDLNAVRKILARTIKGYVPQCGVVDPVWLAKKAEADRPKKENDNKVYRIF